MGICLGYSIENMEEIQNNHLTCIKKTLVNNTNLNWWAGFFKINSSIQKTLDSWRPRYFGGITLRPIPGGEDANKTTNLPTKDRTIAQIPSLKLTLSNP